MATATDAAALPTFAAAEFRAQRQNLLLGQPVPLETARAAERLGQRARAVEDYRFVVDVWRHADPELRPYVDEARAALARL